MSPFQWPEWVGQVLLRGTSGYMKEYLRPLNTDAIVLSLQKPGSTLNWWFSSRSEKFRLCKKSQCGSFLYLSMKCDKSQDSPRNRCAIGWLDQKYHAWLRVFNAREADGFLTTPPPTPFFFFNFYFFAALCDIWDLLVSWPRIEPVPLQWRHGVLTTGPPGSLLTVCV